MFTLVVKYGTGIISMLTDKSDLVEALLEFDDNCSKQLGSCKGMAENILGAELIPLMYTGILGDPKYTFIYQEKVKWEAECQKISLELFEHKFRKVKDNVQ